MWISECLCVLYNVAWEKSQSTGWSIGQNIKSTSDPTNLNPSLWLPLFIITYWLALATLCCKNSVMSTTSLLMATCCGVPIFRHIPTYTDSDIFCSNASLKRKGVKVRKKYLFLHFFSCSCHWKLKKTLKRIGKFLQTYISDKWSAIFWWKLFKLYKQSLGIPVMNVI